MAERTPEQLHAAHFQYVGMYVRSELTPAEFTVRSALIMMGIVWEDLDEDGQQQALAISEAMFREKEEAYRRNHGLV